MLEFIRERAQGWLAWAIVIAIIIPFALWGVNQYFSGGSEVAVAQVNGASISQARFQNAYYRQRQRLQDLLGESFRPDMFPEERLRDQVLQELIRQELLVQAARDAGFTISDSHLSAIIRGIEAFQEDGTFSQARYREVLQRQGEQPGSFEAKVRRDLLTEQVLRGVTDSTFVTPDEVERYLTLEQQTRDVGHLIVPLARFLDQVEVSDEEVSTYYQQNASRYAVPERVKAAYLLLDLKEMAGAVDVDEATLRERYDAQLQNYRTPEERKVRHILIAAGEDADAQAVEAARQEAEALLAKIDGGASFAELAKEHSDDPGSASQGGDLGFFGRGAMVPAFEEAAFSLKPGQTSQPIRTPFGFHIIQVEETRGGETKTFEQVRDQIRKDVQRERGEEAFYEAAEKLANLTYEHPDTLEVAAEQLGLTIQETEPFQRNGAHGGLPANPKFTQAAFSEEVLVEGLNSEAIELGDDRLAVLRVREHLPQQQKPLDSVKGEILSTLKRRKAADMAETKARAIADRLAKGEDATVLAKELDLPWERSAAVSRDSTELDSAIVDTAFGTPRPTGELPAVQTLALPGGDRAVLAVYDVQPGSLEQATDEQKQQAKAAVGQAAGEAAFGALLAALRSRADIEIR